MLKLLESLFNNADKTTGNSGFDANQLQLATAALLVEVATIDQHFDDQELQRLKNLLESQFALSQSDTNALIDNARSASKEASSLYEFTRQINDHCDEAEKIRLMESLWQIAYADEVLDKYEEHIIRRIADLIHVRHRDFILTKNSVRDARTG